MQRSAAIPDPRVDKRKAHSHNASLEGVARERESARSLCTLRERDSIRVVNTRCANATLNAKLDTYAPINFCPIPRSIFVKLSFFVSTGKGVVLSPREQLRGCVSTLDV